MSVDFIFKIAAIGMIVAVLNTLLVRSGREDPGHAHHPGRGDCGFDDVGAEDQRAFLRYKIYV